MPRKKPPAGRTSDSQINPNIDLGGEGDPNPTPERPRKKPRSGMFDTHTGLVSGTTRGRDGGYNAGDMDTAPPSSKPVKTSAKRGSSATRGGQMDYDPQTIPTKPGGPQSPEDFDFDESDAESTSREFPADDWWNQPIDLSPYRRRPGQGLRPSELDISASARDQYIPILYGTRELTGQIFAIADNVDGELPSTRWVHLLYGFCWGETDISTANIYIDGNRLSTWTTQNGNYIGSLNYAIYDGSQTAPDSTFKNNSGYSDFEECYEGLTYMRVSILKDAEGAQVPQITARLTRDQLTDWDSVLQDSEKAVAAAYDLMTSEVGARLDGSVMDSTSWNDLLSWAGDVPAGGFYPRFHFNGAVAGASVLQLVRDICSHFHSPGPIWTGTDWHIYAFRDISSDDMTFDVANEDFIKGPAWKDKQRSQLPSHVTVNYTDGATWQSAAVTTRNDTVTDTDHREFASTMAGIIRREVAKRWSDQFLRLTENEYISTSIEVGREAYKLLPGAGVAITDRIRYSGQRFRVLTVAYRPDGIVVLGIQIYSADSQSPYVEATGEGSGGLDTRKGMAFDGDIGSVAHVIGETGGWASIEGFTPDDLTSSDWTENTPADTTLTLVGSGASAYTEVGYAGVGTEDYISHTVVLDRGYNLFTACVYADSDTADQVRVEFWRAGAKQFVFADSSWHSSTDSAQWRRYGIVYNYTSGSTEIRVYVTNGDGTVARVKGIRTGTLGNMSAVGAKLWEEWSFADSGSVEINEYGVAEFQGSGVSRLASRRLWHGDLNSDATYISIGDRPDATGRVIFADSYWPVTISRAEGTLSKFPAPASQSFIREIRGGTYGGGGPVCSPITTVTADTTLDKTYGTVLVDASSGAVTISLPAASGFFNCEFKIKKIDASANSVTIDGDSIETIDGSATQTITKRWVSVTAHCDGTGWYIT